MVRRVQPSAAGVPDPEFAPFVFRILDRLGLDKPHLKHNNRRETAYIMHNNIKVTYLYAMHSGVFKILSWGGTRGHVCVYPEIANSKLFASSESS